MNTRLNGCLNTKTFGYCISITNYLQNISASTENSWGKAYHIWLTNNRNAVCGLKAYHIWLTNSTYAVCGLKHFVMAKLVYFHINFPLHHMCMLSWLDEVVYSGQVVDDAPDSFQVSD